MAMSISERNSFVLNHIKLTAKIANDFSYLDSSFEDLQQDAIEKFLTIADKYDTNKGCSVSTYIWPHLKNHLWKQNCEMPESLRKKASNIAKVRDELLKENQTVSEENIAAFMGISEKKIKKYETQINQYKTLSLDYDYGDSENDESFSLLDSYSLKDTESPEDDFFKKEDCRIIKKAWSELSDEERNLLSYKTTYNTNLQKPLSLREIADLIGSNRTTVSNRLNNAANHFKMILEKEGLYA